MAEGGGWSVLAREPTGWDDGAPPPVPAYSEFLPAPLVARKPTGAWTDEVRIEGDEHGWRIPAREAMRELTPGLAAVAAALAPRLIALAAGVDRVPGLSRDLLDGNPYLPPAPLPGPPALAVVGLALTRTQDDKGRVRWTLLGGSERGPAAAWWAGLFTAPGRAVAATSAATRLAALAGVAATTVAGLARAGVRILPIGDRPSGDGAPWFGDDAALIPPSLAPLIVDGAGAARARVIVTFRPWAALPPAVQAAAATGAVRLAPAPASLVFAGHRGYRRLAAQLDAAMQLPLLRALPEGLAGLRVPPSGWIDQGGHAGPVSHGGGPTRCAARTAGSGFAATPTITPRSTTTTRSPTRCSPPTRCGSGSATSRSRATPRSGPATTAWSSTGRPPIAQRSPPRRAPSLAAATSAIAWPGRR
jgi:hypothetical protein